MARAAQDIAKRLLDITASGVGLVLLSPIMAGTAVAIARTMGRPVIFRQPRPGRGGKVFELVKFRSMREPTETLVTDADRLTPFGQFIRSTSLDELPTLWNVLKGDMSLVGPRPLLVEYLNLYSDEQARRHEVRPGITGLAQVSGRNTVDWESRLALDVEYVDSRSLWLDMRILARTLASVMRREGINAEGHATMETFTGTEGKGSHDG